jgi:hypothetical protein
VIRLLILALVFAALFGNATRGPARGHRTAPTASARTRASEQPAVDADVRAVVSDTGRLARDGGAAVAAALHRSLAQRRTPEVGFHARPGRKGRSQADGGRKHRADGGNS